VTEHRNRLLASLPNEIFGEVSPYLQPVRFMREHALYRAGERVGQVYFPETGLVSYLIEGAGAGRIETAMVGHDSLVGISVALADPVALTSAIAQTAGHGYALDAGLLRAAADRHASLRRTLLRHHEAVLAQTQQSVLCNVTHTVEERLARWLMRAHDLTGRSTLDLTQEFLADMLGVRRASVSLVAHALQEAGVIAYRRGQIQILDVARLGATACACYGVVRQHYDRLTAPMTEGG
jgi:CRP-like cAMP-binding protein